MKTTAATVKTTAAVPATTSVTTTTAAVTTTATTVAERKTGRHDQGHRQGSQTIEFRTHEGPPFIGRIVAQVQVYLPLTRLVEIPWGR